MNARNNWEERRRHRRIPLEGCAAVITPERGQGVSARCMELSIGGMTLHTRYVPGEGEVVTVRVDSPGGKLALPPLHARAQVRRCHSLGQGEYEVGLEILQVLG